MIEERFENLTLLLVEYLAEDRVPRRLEADAVEDSCQGLPDCCGSLRSNGEHQPVMSWVQGRGGASKSTIPCKEVLADELVDRGRIRREAPVGRRAAPTHTHGSLRLQSGSVAVQSARDHVVDGVGTFTVDGYDRRGELQRGLSIVLSERMRRQPSCDARLIAAASAHRRTAGTPASSTGHASLRVHVDPTSLSPALLLPTAVVASERTSSELSRDRSIGRMPAVGERTRSCGEKPRCASPVEAGIELSPHRSHPAHPGVDR